MRFRRHRPTYQTAYRLTAVHLSFRVEINTDPHRGSHHEQHGFAWVAAPPEGLQSVVACGVGDVIYVCVAVPAALMRSAGSLLLMNRALAACPHCVLQEAKFTEAAHFWVNQHLSAAVDAVTPALTNMHTA